MWCALCVCVCSVCIFCGEHNAEFTEEGLDIHYWKNCPVLKRCQYCRQVCTADVVVIFHIINVSV